MKFLFSKINIISGLHVAPQANGLFKLKVFKFLKPLHIELSAKIQMAQELVP
jgi:hypothetical protein